MDVPGDPPHVLDLLVVDEIDVLKLNPFAAVHLLLQFERVVVEMLLQHFVCKVDAELFKTVELKRE